MAQESTTESVDAVREAPTPRVAVETNGINVITEAERKGTPRQLFWPWFGANVSVFGLAYGSFLLGFGISFWQAIVAGVVGIVVSFLLCGFIAIAGKRGSAPTLVLSRAAFGVNGNRAPSLLSWVLTVGWETALVSLATLATAQVFDQLGWSGGTATKLVALLVVAALVVGGGILGFDVIMRMQAVITWVTGILTVVYIVLVADHMDWSAVSALPSGSTAAFVGLPRAEATLPQTKITRVRIYQPPNLNQLFNQSNMLCTVETDGGLTGIGEGGSKDTLEQCAGSLIGKNAFQIETL